SRNLLPSNWREILNGPAFLLNLERRPERRAAGEAALRAAGFTDVRWFRATDGGNPYELRAGWERLGSPPLAPPPHDFRDHPGSQACLMSHLRIWEEIERRDLDWAVIFEDDIVFHPRWRELAPEFFAATPKDVDILYLGGNLRDAPDTGLVAKCRSWTMHAYIVTREGIPRLRDALKPAADGMRAIDVMLVEEQGREIRDERLAPFVWWSWNIPDGESPRHIPSDSIQERGLVFQNRNWGSDCGGFGDDIVLAEPDTEPLAEPTLPDTWPLLLTTPAFILNLDRRPDRLALAVDAVWRAGFSDIRRVRAIDGQDAALLARAWDAVGRPPFHPGEPLFADQTGRQGCFLSMVLLLRWIVEREIPVAIVFEDDPLFHSRWADLAPGFYAETRRDLDMLYFGGQAERWDRDDQDSLPTATTLPPLRSATDWRGAARVLREPTYKLGAFCISLDGARKVLDRVLSNDGGVYAIDNMINHLQRRARGGVPGAEFSWETWNAADEPDPALTWLEQQRNDETGLVYQHLELGTDIDERWLNYSAPTVDRAREAAALAGVDVPPSL
ncbi:MAG: glycosyltransferase family 25 protein, partial [Thermomicrobiales bacterium]